MRIEDTTLPFLEEDCLQRFGRAEGAAVFSRTQERYRDLLEGADDRGSPAIREHLQKKLFPPMAYYLTLLERGIPREKALDLTGEETRRAAGVKREQMRRLAGLPFAYTLYRFACKSFMRKNFPEEGWETEWVRCDGEELHFNLGRCIYWDLTRLHSCPELCRLYCENDLVSFSGLLPKIRFERGGTLGTGAPRCDFHFLKGASRPAPPK